MDLKSFREDKLKMTQAKFAELIEEEQSNISRWEKTGELPLAVLQKISAKTGTDFNTLLGWKPPVSEPLVVDNSWLRVDFVKKDLKKCISELREKVDLDIEHKKAYIDDLLNLVDYNLVKPKIALVGRSDTGKSTMINSLLGMNKMPASWTPTTSIAVYIKHISDRPSFIEEDVWIFTDKLDGELSWDESKLQDENYCRKWKIGAGTIESLASFGTRQGENYSKNAGSAVVFVDAPILCNCDIIDLPGFGTETEADDNITFKVTKSADVIIYLSQANGFMRIEDINYLKRNISELPTWERKGENDLEPLCNLFIVGSQAHTINGGNKEIIKTIFNERCLALLGTLPDHYWDNRKKISGYMSDNYGKKELRKRFFAYTTDIPELCAEFNVSLKKIIELLPVIIEKKSKALVSEFVSVRRPSLEAEIQKYEGIKAERDKYVALLEEIKRNERLRIKNNNDKRDEVRKEIGRLKNNSISEFSDFCSKTITVDSIIELIKMRKVNNKKDDVEQFGSWFQGHLQERGELILKENSENLAVKAKEYVDAFSASISDAFDTIGIKVDFDAGWAFASALGKIGMWGGLGAFLFGNGVFIFGSISLILSSVGTVALGASSLGPIGMALGVIVITALGIIKLFGGGWEKSVAKKMVKALDEYKVVEHFRMGISQYWEHTMEAFNNATDMLEKDWNDYVNNLQSIVDDYDIAVIEKKLCALCNIKDFFEKIPL